MKRCRSVYLVIAVEAPSDEEASERVSQWLLSLPKEYSGRTLGFQGMTLATTPLDVGDALNLDARTSNWYREYDDIHN